MPRFLLLALLLVASSTASAIVIRHDVDDSKYRIPASDFPALVDMPNEGHGVLIAPLWFITAAHTIPGNSNLKQVDLVGRNPRSGFRRMSFWPSFDPHSAESRLAVPPYVIRRYVSPQ